MANLIIQENGAERTYPAVHGEEITIQTPCDCSAVTGVQIAGVVYPFYDAAGKLLPTGTGLFTNDSLIRVLIDTVNKRATIINHAVTPSVIGAEPAIESTDKPGCYYRMVGNEKEWLNPPMVGGVEYRTTERYLGEPVYVFLFDLGYTDGGSRTVAHGRPVARSIEISLMNNAEDITSSGGMHDLGFNTTTIHWNADWAMGGAKFVLKYTK